MSGSSDDIMRAWANWHQPLSIPLLHWVNAERTPQGPLPGESVFAQMTPEQQHFFQLLMGQDVGQALPGGQVNPYYLMSILQGPQGAILPPDEQGE